MGEANEPRSECPINAAIEVFGDRWSLIYLAATPRSCQAVDHVRGRRLPPELPHRGSLREMLG
jgi:hypothetical protein